jgi:hypothetical protein
VTPGGIRRMFPAWFTNCYGKEPSLQPSLVKSSRFVLQGALHRHEGRGFSGPTIEAPDPLPGGPILRFTPNLDLIRSDQQFA